MFRLDNIFKSCMADTAEALRPLMEALAIRFDQLEELVKNVQVQQRISEASFEELQARFGRATHRNPEIKAAKTPASTDRIIEFLRSRDARTKPRDLHEVEALAEIIEARTAEQVYEVAVNRLSIIYTATTRGWREAQTFARKDLEEQLGLPAVVHQPTSRPVQFAKGRRHAPPRQKKSWATRGGPG